MRAAQICVFLIANGASYDLEFIRYKQKCVAWMCSLAILVGIGVVTFFAAPSKADVFFVCGGVLMGVFFLPYWHEVAGKEIERRKDKMLRD